MPRSADRRSFLRSAAFAPAAAALADMPLLRRLTPVAAADVRPDPSMVQFTADVEPLVRLIEETPRDKLLEKVAERIQSGTTYRQVLAALQLAGIRNVQPRPSVGFKFHAVLVVNSAHLAALNSPDEHRWLPIFWALDYFKDAQARDVSEGDWTMPAVAESRVPKADKARAIFVEAMDAWDEAKADVAAAALARTAGADELFELFCRYGARDFRAIGHKAIFVANATRTLQCIGRQHAEPIMRSLAYALLNHEGAPNPAQSDLEPDRPWRENVARAKKIRPDWLVGKLDAQATRDLLSTLYDGTWQDACDQTVEILNSGVGPQSVWDALLLEGGELLMRQPGIVGLHTLTTTNALRYAFDQAGSDETRKMLLLQNVAFLPMFREAMKQRGKVQPTKILELEPMKSANGAAEGAKSQPLDAIFESVSRDRSTAARETLSYIAAGGDVEQFAHAAQLLVFLKGRDSHDYKFSSAVLEDFRNLSPEWRGRYLAASVFNLLGSRGPDSPLVARTKSALSA